MHSCYFKIRISLHIDYIFLLKSAFIVKNTYKTRENVSHICRVYKKIIERLGTSLAVQWLRLCVSHCRGCKFDPWSWNYDPTCWIAKTNPPPMNPQYGLKIQKLPSSLTYTPSPLSHHRFQKTSLWIRNGWESPSHNEELLKILQLTALLSALPLR